MSARERERKASAFRVSFRAYAQELRCHAPAMPEAGRAIPRSPEIEVMDRLVVARESSSLSAGTRVRCWGAVQARHALMSRAPVRDRV